MNNLKKILVEGNYQIAAFYVFLPLDTRTISLLIEGFRSLGNKQSVKGTILIASEGVNGTICGSIKGVGLLVKFIQNLTEGCPLELKYSYSSKQAFRRLKVRRKPEIVTMGEKGINPIEKVGRYVDPVDWNDFLTDPNTVVIDTRNDYEIRVGSFNGAINPKTKCFREFPLWVENYFGPYVEKNRPKRIAMFCTGGIRCEKATSYLRKEGFSDVHHLRGGVLNYLEKVSPEESLWNGECFVFDRRVSLNHDLSPGMYLLCHACGMPLSPEDCKSLSYLKGVQCSYCEDVYSDSDKARFAERQRQIDNRVKKNNPNSDGETLW